jgi:hypothetical protein
MRRLTSGRATERCRNEVRKLADQAYEHLKHDPHSRGTRLKKVGRFWSARVGSAHRALAVEASDGLVWFWIGSHDDYDRLIA